MYVVLDAWQGPVLLFAFVAIFGSILGLVLVFAWLVSLMAD